MSLAEIETDPRTGLAIIDIPLDQMKYFADLKGSVIHWFGHVTKYNQKWSTQTRVCIISDRCIYLCHTDGGITRCIQIVTIQQVFLSSKTAIGFKVAQPDYDLLIAPSDEKKREEIFQIIERIYYSLTGDKLPSRRLVGGGELAEQSMQNFINLKKPDNFRLQIEPLGTTSALTKKMTEKKQKENEDRKIVEEEFERVKRGLMSELEKYRTVEYSQMQSELERREKLLRERDIEIAHIKETCVSLDDPEVWRKCPNCKSLRKMLESHPSDDKQKVFRLQRDIESQRHIVQHLQAALLHRNMGGGGGDGGGGAGGGGGEGKSLQMQALQAQLDQAKFKNRELQQLILDSPFLTSDVKHQALQLAFTNPAVTGGNGYNGIVGGGSGGGLGGANSAVLAQKDREIQHLKTVLKDTTFKHLQELEQLRRQMQSYDDEVALYVNKLKGLSQEDRQIAHMAAPYGNQNQKLMQQRLQQGSQNTQQQIQQLMMMNGAQSPQRGVAAAGGAAMLNGMVGSPLSNAPPTVVKNIADAYTFNAAASSGLQMNGYTGNLAPTGYSAGPPAAVPLAPSQQNFFTRTGSEGVGGMPMPMVGGPYAPPRTEHTESMFGDAHNDANYPTDNPSHLNPTHAVIARVKHYDGYPITQSHLPAGRLYADPMSVAAQLQQQQTQGGVGMGGTPSRQQQQGTMNSTNANNSGASPRPPLTSEVLGSPSPSKSVAGAAAGSNAVGSYPVGFSGVRAYSGM